jgi:hypothetical protein
LHQDVVFNLAPDIGDFLLNEFFRERVLHVYLLWQVLLANYQARIYEQL